MIEPKRIDINCPGYTVVADWYKGRDARRILLSLPGWTSSRKNYHDILSAIVTATGMSALVFDYSGHGDSPFEADETRLAQHFLEVIAVFDWLKKKHPTAQISVMGASYGGYLAAELVRYRDVEKLVLRVPAVYKPTDFYSLAKDIDRAWTNKIYRKDKPAMQQNPVIAAASQFKGKTLVVVHELDEQVPRETTDVYTKAFHADTYLAKGFTHSITSKTPKDDLLAYRRAIANWLLKKEH